MIKNIRTTKIIKIFKLLLSNKKKANQLYKYMF